MNFDFFKEGVGKDLCNQVLTHIDQDSYRGLSVIAPSLVNLSMVDVKWRVLVDEYCISIRKIPLIERLVKTYTNFLIESVVDFSEKNPFTLGCYEGLSLNMAHIVNMIIIKKVDELPITCLENSGTGFDKFIELVKRNEGKAICFCADVLIGLLMQKVPQFEDIIADKGKLLKHEDPVFIGKIGDTASLLLAKPWVSSLIEKPGDGFTEGYPWKMKVSPGIQEKDCLKRLLDPVQVLKVWLSLEKDRKNKEYIESIKNSHREKLENDKRPQSIPWYLILLIFLLLVPYIMDVITFLKEHC